MKKFFLLIIIFFYGQLTSVQAANYSKTIYGKKMSLSAPIIKRYTRSVVATSGTSRQKRVYFMYEKQLFRANRVVFKGGKILMQGGFWGSSKRATLEGTELIYNLRNNFFGLGGNLILLTDNKIIFYAVE